MQYVLDNQTKYVVVAPRSAVQALIRLYFWNGKGPSPFHLSPPIEGEPPIPISSVLRKGSPLTEMITRRVLDIEAAGLVRGKFMPETTEILAQANQVKDTYVEPEYVIVVTLESISLYLWTCVGILIVAIVVFLMELCAPTVIMLVEGLNEFRRRIFWR